MNRVSKKRWRYEPSENQRAARGLASPQKTHAVTAPRRVKLDEDVLGRVHDDGIKVGRVEDLDGRDDLFDTAVDTRLVGDEAGKVLEITASVVVFRGGRSFGEPLQSGETLDTKTSAEVPVSVGVDLCNDDLVLGMGESFSELLVSRGQVLAVATPRCD